jgi:hypothetical protein
MGFRADGAIRLGALDKEGQKAWMACKQRSNTSERMILSY